MSQRRNIADPMDGNVIIHNVMNEPKPSHTLVSIGTHAKPNQHNVTEGRVLLRANRSMYRIKAAIDLYFFVQTRRSNEKIDKIIPFRNQIDFTSFGRHG